MDPSLLVEAFDKFEDLRVERFPIARELAAKYTDPTELLADVANLVMLLYASHEASKQKPAMDGFRPDLAGFKSDSK